MKTFKDQDTEPVAGINGREVLAKVKDANGEVVTLVETDNTTRYDLCYTQVFVCGALRSAPEQSQATLEMMEGWP